MFYFLSSEFEGEKGGIIGEDDSSDLDEIEKSLTLSAETVDDVLVMVGDGGLEEEGEVGEDWAELLAIDLHSREELAQNDHIVHEGCSEKGVFTDVV